MSGPVQLDVLDAEPARKAELVRILEDALVLAKEGELSSVAIAWVHRSGAVNGATSKAPNVPLLIGSLAVLSHRMNAKLDK